MSRPNPKSLIPNPCSRCAATALILLLIVVGVAVSPEALKPDVLRSVGAVPAHVAGRFREPIGFQQSASGQYFVFDRRAHRVFGLDAEQSSSWEIIQIGAETGRIIEPTAFAVEPNGTFVVADAPNGRERIQIFTPAGFRIGGFMLPGRMRPRVVFENFVLNGIGSLQYTGTSILMSQPETGGLITEYMLSGVPNRTIGNLRRTGHEQDREVHFALNSGIPLIDPSGGFYFVFQTGEPVFQKYDRDGKLLFERRMQGREVDDVMGRLPTSWPKRKTDEGELPLVTPTIRTAAVDRRGNLWVSFLSPFTYVYDADGDKIRTVQFRAAGLTTPNSLFFGKDDRLLVTPGLFEFDSGAGQAGRAGQAGGAGQAGRAGQAGGAGRAGQAGGAGRAGQAGGAAGRSGRLDRPFPPPIQPIPPIPPFQPVPRS